MTTRCITCGRADLKEGLVQLTGKVRGETYTVEMMGLVCPQCRYQTIKGPDMPEFGRLLADKYRAAHGLLTSVQIKDRRLQRGLSQQAFADYLKRGVASVKRWEMGKIQEPDNDRHIREMTDPPLVTTQVYMVEFLKFSVPTMGGSGTSNLLFSGSTTVAGTVTSIGGPKQESQWCAVGGQSTQGHTTSTSAIKSFSSSDSTSPLSRGIERRTYA